MLYTLAIAVIEIYHSVFVECVLRLHSISYGFVLHLHRVYIPSPLALSALCFCMYTSLLKKKKAHRCIHVRSFAITMHEVWWTIDKYVTWVFQAQTYTISATHQQKLISVSSCLYNIQLASFSKFNACKCSAQFANLRNFEIALRKSKIAKLLTNFEIANRFRNC